MVKVRSLLEPDPHFFQNCSHFQYNINCQIMKTQGPSADTVYKMNGLDNKLASVSTQNMSFSEASVNL